MLNIKTYKAKLNFPVTNGIPTFYTMSITSYHNDLLISISKVEGNKVLFLRKMVKKQEESAVLQILPVLFMVTDLIHFHLEV